MTLRLRAAAATDVGNLRDNNQDDLLIIDDALFVVADGMGGHVAGEVASREAVEAMSAAYEAPGSTDDVRQAVRLANGAVWKRGDDDPSYRGMGTTVTAVAVIDNDMLAVANVGDSRTYLMRDGELMQLTQDHSFVQEAVRSGQLTRAQAESHPRRSQLTRALGVGDDVDVDVDVIGPLTGDRLLLCSDGLWDEVGDQLIAMVLTNHRDPDDAAGKLVHWAKEAGGRDNITVIVLDVVDGGAGGRAASASAALDDSGDAPTATSRPGGTTVTRAARGPSGPAEREAPGPSGPAEQATQDSSGLAEREARDRSGPAEQRGARNKSGREERGALNQGALDGSDSEGTLGRASPVDRSIMQSAAAAAPSAPRSRLLTWRVVAFVVVLFGVLVAAALIVSRGGPAWAVGLDGNDVVVKEGSKVVERTALRVSQLPPAVQAELGRDRRVEDRADADAYIAGITRLALQQGTLTPGAGVVVPPTSSTAPPEGAPSTPPAGDPNGVPGAGVPVGP